MNGVKQFDVSSASSGIFRILLRVKAQKEIKLNNGGVLTPEISVAFIPRFGGKMNTKVNMANLPSVQGKMNGINTEHSAEICLGLSGKFGNFILRLEQILQF